MPPKAEKWMRLCAMAALLRLAAAGAAHAEEAGGQPLTATPIKHLLIIIGENRTFDRVFGVCKPRRPN